MQSKRQSTQQSAGSAKRMTSLNSTGAGGLKLSSKQSQQQDDSLSQLQDPQNLEQTNEDLKQELAFVKAEVDRKYAEMQAEKNAML